MDKCRRSSPWEQTRTLLTHKTTTTKANWISIMHHSDNMNSPQKTSKYTNKDTNNMLYASVLKSLPYIVEGC